MDDPKICLLIWANMPSHHQSAFYDALREAGFNLVVHYYGTVSAERIALGWGDAGRLLPWEKFVSPVPDSVYACRDWRERIHIVPGYGLMFLRQLVRFLSSEGTSWMHWSEPARQGVRWWASYPLKRWYAGMVNAHALAALAIGNLAKADFMRWGISPEKIAFLPYAVEGFTGTTEVDAELGAFRERFKTVFMFLGTLCKAKGIDVLLDAFSRVKNVYPDVGLALVGRDTRRGCYERQARRHSLQEHVLFRGAIPASEIGSALRASDVLVHPTLYDGWGMVLNEAASLGKPLIATDACGSAYHLINNGENGFLVPAGDSLALAEAMMRYASDPKLTLAHGQRSREIFREFTPQKNADRLSKILAGRTDFRLHEAGSRSALCCPDGHVKDREMKS